MPCGLVLGAMIWILASSVALGADVEEKDPEKLPDPEEIVLPTNDGRQVPIQYYASLAGKKAVPVIIIPGWGEEAADYERLALYLQKKGHAIVVPDLRGHGDNKTAEIQGKVVTLNLERFRDRDIHAMITQDLEAVKQFLVKKNNAGECNIEKLCVIGVEFGTLLAVNWAVVDWSWPILPSFKQGQDVKAIVLISPEKANRKLRFQQALDDRNVASRLSYLILVGKKDERAAKNAKFVNGRLRKYHPTPPKEERKTRQSLFLVEADTNLQGAKLLNENEFKAKAYIAKFIERRLIDKSIPWGERNRP